MFENIIEQGAVSQLRDDILSGRNAPCMLFFGPPESGKGSSALELARVLSCETDGGWKCSCPSCEKHRYLQHTDLLLLGRRPFPAEIAACSSVFLKNPSNKGTKTLFIRSLRKLQMRFCDVLMEDDPKAGKLSSVLQSLEEGLSDLWIMDTASAGKTALEKLAGSLVKDALKLESEGFGNKIPVEHIRKASYWCRLAPNGKRKTLIIENFENMKNEGHNSLLKLLEEPPQTVSIVLTTQRREAIMPTILSRLRPYRFLKRSAESEKEVIRRVFQDSFEAKASYEAKASFEVLASTDEKSPSQGSSLIGAYLNSFLAGKSEKLYPLAAWFIASLARIAAQSLKRNRAAIPEIINSLGERYAPIADAAGFERSVKSAVIVKTLLDKSGNFEDDSFSRFLKLCLELVCTVTREEKDPHFIAYNDMFKKYIGEADTASGVLNQSAALALEALLYKLKKAMTGGGYG